MNPKSLSPYIDQTLLRSDATRKDIERLCLDAVSHQFACVCIQPVWVKEAMRLLEGSQCNLCSVVGFPLGANTTFIKAEEARELSEQGVDELDMVMNIGWLKSKEYQKVQNDIEAVVKAAPSALVKVIIETCLLSDEEKRLAAQLIVQAGAHFVKTSTGFSKEGAKVEDIILLKGTIGTSIKIKASGGIKDQETAFAMIKAGASRIGTSNGVALVSFS